MEAATAMIFNPVSLWVFGFARNAALDSPESVTDMRRSPLGRRNTPLPLPCSLWIWACRGIASR